MASTRLTNHMREVIIGNVMKATFEGRKSVFAKAASALANLIYHEYVTPEAEKLMKKLPDGFFTKTARLNISIHSGSEYVRFSEDFLNEKEHLLPQLLYGRYGNAEITNLKLYKLVVQHHNQYAVEVFQPETELSNKLKGVFAAHTTLEALVKTWPEIKEHVPVEFFTKSGTAGVPMVQIQSLNETIAALTQPRAA